MTNGGYRRPYCSDLLSQTEINSNKHLRYVCAKQSHLDGVADKPHGKKSTIHQIILNSPEVGTS